MKRTVFCLLVLLASPAGHADERAPARVAVENLTVVRADPGNYRELAARL
ncbi:MAG: hypothetical protein GY953_51310, partial [bacterium]|nr:hypothetical protein [bacterium]